MKIDWTHVAFAVTVGILGGINGLIFGGGSGIAVGVAGAIGAGWGAYYITNQR